MKRPLHILYLARWYPHKFDPMYGLFVKRHAEAAAMRHQVSVFYVHAAKELEQSQLVEEKKGLISEYFYYYQPAHTGIRFIDSLLNVWKFVKGHIVLSRKINRPDLLHVHILTRLGVFAYIIKKLYKIPYVITEHWSRYQPGNRGYEGRLRQYLTRLSARHATALTTVTKNLYEAMEKHGIRNKTTYILYNVVNTEHFFPNREPVKKDPGALKKLIHISCFDDEPKNISGIIEGIGLVSKKRNDFTIDLVGDGKDREILVNKAKQLGLYNQVIFFPGLKEGMELGDAVRAADALVLFSHYENLPVVINEAFCCGVPVVSSDVGGIREIVKPENGILVKPGDMEAFTKAIHYMLDHYDEYDPQTISQEGFRLFSTVHISEKLDEIYANAVN